MFQFEDTKAKRAATRIARDLIADRDEPQVSHAALLAWAEHCVECAAPACYTSCDLYLATPAGKCRRFEDGLIVNQSASGPHGPAAEARFRRWGKLEAQGNAHLLPVDEVRRRERLLTLVTPLAAKLGRGLARVTGQSRWATAMEAVHKRINDRLQARPGKGEAPDAFIAEIINPGDEPVQLTLTAQIDKARLARAIPSDQLPRPMAVGITAPPGFSRHVTAIDGMQEILLSGLPFNLALTPADGRDPHLIFRRLDLVALAKSVARANPAAKKAPAKAAKLVIFDLDNTLWDGVLLEGEVRLRQGVRALFETLDARGILISVASKNARDDAMGKLKAFGLDEFVLHERIGWGPKSEGVKKIVQAIDIGSDTVLFIDDNPFERAEVEGAVEGVEVLPDTALATLAEHPRLQGAVTPESRARRQMYREAMVREQAAESYGDDYLSFLRDCQIEVEIRRDHPDDFERVVELVQRTNQLNFSGRKYGREEITQILQDPQQDRHVVICRDKFGSYGTVGFCLSHREALPTGGEAAVIDDFMLSCRVQGKFIEQALFWRIAEEVGREPAQALIVNFKRTDRNRAAEMVLEKLGFSTDSDGPLRRDLAPGDFAVDFLTVT